MCEMSPHPAFLQLVFFRNSWDNLQCDGALRLGLIKKHQSSVIIHCTHSNHQGIITQRLKRYDALFPLPVSD